MTLGKRWWRRMAALIAGMLVAGSAMAQVNPNPTTEPRLGPNHLIVFTFDRPVISGVASISEGTATVGTPVFAGNEMQVPLTAVPDMQCVTINASNVVAADGTTGGTGSTRIGFMAGDATQNRRVQGTDLIAVSNQFLNPVTSATYLEDVNTDGFIRGTDLIAVSNRFLNVMPVGCP